MIGEANMMGRGIPKFRRQRLTHLLEILLDDLTQSADAGGIHTAPELRLLLVALALTNKAELVVETGYDIGLTTEAMALASTKVIAVDNESEYQNSKHFAEEVLKDYPNVERIVGDALAVLKLRSNESVDLVFIDDYHHFAHIEQEVAELRRILKPKGLAVFHDAKRDDNGGYADSKNLTWFLKSILNWNHIELDSFSLKDGTNVGIVIFQKP